MPEQEHAVTRARNGEHEHSSSKMYIGRNNMDVTPIQSRGTQGINGVVPYGPHALTGEHCWSMGYPTTCSGLHPPVSPWQLTASMRYSNKLQWQAEPSKVHKNEIRKHNALSATGSLAQAGGECGSAVAACHSLGAGCGGGGGNLEAACGGPQAPSQSGNRLPSSQQVNEVVPGASAVRSSSTPRRTQP